MAQQEFFWMACDSIESARAEYGPFSTREEAELQARRLGFGYLLRYEHLLGEDDQIEDVRTVFLEIQPPASTPLAQWHTRCASCGFSATHEHSWQAEVWADIHEFENSRHLVRLFERTAREGMREVSGWRTR
jgi:hypothetical protein